MSMGCAVACGGAGEESEDAAKTDKRIGAFRSQLASQVPDPKRVLVVTAQPVVHRQYRESCTG